MLFKRLNIINGHPLLFITTALIYGIWHQSASLSPWVLIVISLVGTLLFYVFVNIKNVPLLYSTLFLCATPFGAIRYQYQRNNHYNFQKVLYNKTMNIKGTITSIEKIKNSRFKNLITLNAHAIKIHNDTWTPIKKVMQLYVKSLPNFDISDIVEFRSLKNSKNKNPDYTKYLIKEGIATTIFCDAPQCKILYRPAINFKRTLYNYRKNLIDSIETKLPRKTFSLFRSIFLGKRKKGSFYTDQAKQQFKIWGISHYLARSGLHLIVFIIIWRFFLGWIQLATRKKTFLLMILSIIYSILSWATISFNRALSTFLLYQLCILLTLKSNITHMLCIVCCMTLIINPHQLFFLDFQLSFILTFAIAMHSQTVALKN
ncbi:ComEC/Rec2 family competence protein [Candidatus Dependentiae bacterium]|nr:ComEC/Rec2 family competence protein [Candidatus Dependentiae bacterium]